MPLTLTTRRTIEIAASCAALLLAALIFHAWLAAHDDQLRLASTLATQKQALDAADARERDRNATLKDALAQIDTLKRTAQNETPAQLARALQDALQLPQPITIATRRSAIRFSRTGRSYRRASRRRLCLHPPHPRHSATTPSHRMFVPPASGRRLCLHPPRSSKTQKIPRKKPSATNHSSIYFSTASPTTKLSTNSTNVEPGQTPRSSPKHKAKTPHHRKTSRELPPHFPPPTQAPRISVLDTSATSAASPAAAAPQSTAEIPAADLAPLYNYVQDCRACQLQLAAAKQNSSDDAAKIRALTRERDAAVTATKGGPFWLRLKRNAHWLAIGAAVGAVTSAAALCHTGHCR